MNTFRYVDHVFETNKCGAAGRALRQQWYGQSRYMWADRERERERERDMGRVDTCGQIERERERDMGR